MEQSIRKAHEIRAKSLDTLSPADALFCFHFRLRFGASALFTLHFTDTLKTDHPQRALSICRGLLNYENLLEYSDFLGGEGMIKLLNILR